MPNVMIAGRQVRTDGDGYFSDPAEWTEDMAAEIAARSGITALREDHWRVLSLLRGRYLEGQRPPTGRLLSKQCGVSLRRLYQMFPGRPVKVAAKIAGLPEPRWHLGGCLVEWGPVRR